MEKRTKKGIIIAITSLLLVTLLLLGLTYAYYRTRIIGNQSTDPSISVTSEKMEIVYEDGSAYFSTEGKIEPGFTYSKQFTVKNTGNTTEKFSVVLEDFVNEFTRSEDWVYSLAFCETDNTLCLYGDNFIYRYYNLPNHPTNKLVLGDQVSINPNESLTFELYLNYKNPTNVNQSVDMGKNLSFRINIDEPVTKEGYALTSASYTKTQFEDALNTKAISNNGKFYLTQDTLLEEKVTIPSANFVSKLDTIEVDLNGYTLTLKDNLYFGGHVGLIIKNGTIKRDASFTNGVMLTANLKTNMLFQNVRIDGMNVETSSAASYGMALVIRNIGSDSNITFDNCYIANHIGTENHKLGRVLEISEVNDVVVKSTTVANNISTNGQLFMVQNSGSLLFDEKSVIKNNVSASSSGLDIRDTNAIVSGTIINNKTTLADGNGGGLYTLLQSTDKTVTITSTAKINNNESAAGGGVYVNAGKNDTPVGKVIIEGGEIKGNVATATPLEGTYKDGGGAGIYVARGDLEINGGIIENNNSICGIGHAILVSNAGGNINGGKLTINGGTVLGTIFAAPNYSQFVVNGGTFDNDISAYLGGSHTVQNSNGKYIVS